MAPDGAQVDAAMQPEVAVFDCEQRVDDVRRNLGDERLLAVLRLEHTDLAAARVVQHAALGKTRESTDFIERDGGLFVGVQHPPQARGHAND